jgi:hypothetical protein
MFGETQARPSIPPEKALKGGLPHLDRLPPQILAVKFEEVEGIEDDGSVVLPFTHALNEATPTSSQDTASPSTIQDLTLSATAPAAIKG